MVSSRFCCCIRDYLIKVSTHWDQVVQFFGTAGWKLSNIHGTFKSWKRKTHTRAMFNTLISLSSKHFTLTQLEHSTDLDLWERLSDGLMTRCLFIHQSNCVSHQPLKLCTLIAKRGRSDHHIQQAFNLRPRQTHKTKLGRIAQLVKCQTERPSAMLMQLSFPGAARDFPPWVNFQCRFCYCVCPTPVCHCMHQHLCAC